ncbi:tripartite tricarboxylate transporter substrate binding protein [Sulfitobacter sp. 1A05707]|uniref:tripartite tricarboxylate transporter substrate binding protein n=1 Tax=unclassified Sulfitobacter TaxID=196795 RepID=UPI003745FC2F
MTDYNRRQFLAAAGTGALAMTLAPKAALAREWPARPVTIVIQYGAGGGTDTIIRALAKALEKSFDVGIRAVNQPGAAGALATDHVEGKRPDGYWLLGNADYNKIFRVLGYADEAPWQTWQFYKIGRSLPAWAVPMDSPYQTLGDVVDAAKANPGGVRISNSGIGTVWHEATLVALEYPTGASFSHIPYQGGAPAALAALQGEADVVATGIQEQVEYLRSGKLRNIGVFLDEPLEIEGLDTPLQPVTASVPGSGDLGLIQGVYALAVRRDSPQEVHEALRVAVGEAVADEGFAQVLANRVMFPEFLTGEEADREAALFESVTSWLYHDNGLEGLQKTPEEVGIPRPKDFAAAWPPADYKAIF